MDDVSISLLFHIIVPCMVVCTTFLLYKPLNNWYCIFVFNSDNFAKEN